MYGELADGQGMRLLRPLQYQSTQKISNDSSTGTPAGSPVPCHLRVGIYRDLQLKNDFPGGATVWYDNIACATTRRAAEEKAFS